MNEGEEYYKNPRFLLLVFVVLGSIVAIMPTYSNGKFSSNLQYGLDIEGGTWLQLQLQGVVAQIEVDDAGIGNIIKTEFGKLLNDPNIKIQEITPQSIIFTTSEETTKYKIESLKYGTASISSINGTTGTRVTLRTSKAFIIQKYLESKLNTEVKSFSSGKVTRFEIRKDVTQDELKKILEPIGGKVLDFREGVTPETLEETKTILSDKLNNLGLKQIPIRTVGNDFILIDLAGIDMETARDIAAKPGKFEIRIQVKDNETEHVLFGDEIKSVGVIKEDKNGKWGVPFVLSNSGAKKLQDAAIKYGATTNPSLHHLIMYLDEKEIFNAPLSIDLARDLQIGVVTNLISTTGKGDEGKKKAKELQIHLRSGALPVNVKVVGSGQVSAELGSKFKQETAIAGIITLIIVALVVFLRYRQKKIIIPMLSTSFSEVIILLGFSAIIGWQLDLAAIAGIIAVIGTGVDDLIIITDEVLAGGIAPQGTVYKSRLTKAFAIIFASAATTIIAMSPLFVMGFGALKSFAFITIVGILIGVLIARPSYAVIIQDKLVDKVEET